MFREREPQFDPDSDRNNKSYYARLGVSENATTDEIKTAYRKLALQHHPDRNPGNMQAETRFREVTEAYEILRDPEQRSKYDATLSHHTPEQHYDSSSTHEQTDRYAGLDPELTSLLRRADAFTDEQLQQMGIDPRATADQLREQSRRFEEEKKEIERKRNKLQAELDRLNKELNKYRK